MPRYFLEIAYVGTAYHGWQNQPRHNSVQGEMERALATMTQQKGLNVVGCGRTDAGVHASSYFLHTDLVAAPKDLERFTHRLNGLLPHDISVMRTFPVPEDAHARFSATERGYRYRVHRYKQAFLHDRSLLYHPPVDLDAMNRACEVLLTEKDFTSFCKAGTDVKTMICDVRHAEWVGDDRQYAFTIRADRFLRNMVRAIVGTCLRIGRGIEPVDSMERVLAARDRSAAGRSAAACGLYLEKVHYPFLEA